jgi:large subunit ribosomal protein L5
MSFSRLHERYQQEVRPWLRKEQSYTNDMAVPRLEKIVINMGLGEGKDNIKRRHNPIGACVTLRGEHMYEFLDRLINIALPRVRDFKGLPGKAFDGRGNYTMGLRDQLVFPEVDYARVDRVRGMSITMVTTAKTDEEARTLLKQLGLPLRD